ncbi:hypothetical protein GQ457_17G005790 [Hibiscus cannabinus]
MEDRITNLEQGQKGLEARLNRVEQSIKDHIAQSQVSIIDQLTALLVKRDKLSVNHPIRTSVGRTMGAIASQPLDLGANYENEAPDLSKMDELEKRIKGGMEKAYEEKF